MESCCQQSRRCENTDDYGDYYSGVRQTLEKDKWWEWMGHGNGHSDGHGDGYGDGYGSGPTEGVVVVRDVGSRPAVRFLLLFNLNH